MAKAATAAAAATKALEDEAAKAANAKTKESGTEEIVLYSDEYYAAQKAKRQGLGLTTSWTRWLGCCWEWIWSSSSSSQSW